ncbi:hypothetical protein KEM52_000662, partial [Ascosphaera acerosa]
MALSKQSRLTILLAIDSVFFFIELTVGYAVHSLALVADSFHMLNDVLSLLVGLWAVKVARTKKSSKSYTYGWQRAETLGALINGVFLIALCVSIFMEAIQRLVEVQTVNQPVLVLVVGSFGLLSNIVGLLLFGHGHDHGGEEGEGEGAHDHEHDHEHEHDEEALLEPYHDEVGVQVEHAHVHPSPSARAHGYQRGSRLIDPADERGAPIDVLPAQVMANAQHAQQNQAFVGFSGEPPARENGAESGSGSGSESELDDPTEWSRDPNRALHPANMRREIIEAGRRVSVSGGRATPPSSSHSHSHSHSHPHAHDGATERSGLLSGRDRRRGGYNTANLHTTHIHARPKDSKHGGHGHGHSHGHSHGDLNMRGVFLHVLGDALGNVGVIAAALIIWLTDWEWRMYSDPAISLIITCIILYTAIPLCKAASRMLLQAVPPGLSIDHIAQDIESLPGVVSCHHVHVWQLSDTKLVASLHIRVATEIKDEGSDRYMELAREVRSCLHAYGIHSSTIQPEFQPDADGEGNAGDAGGDHHDGSPAAAAAAPVAAPTGT